MLVAAGRAPNIEDIGLKEAGVQLTDRGFIKINERMETTAKGIYAIGDVAGPPMLAHKGQREGVVLAELLAGDSTRTVMNYGNIPNATYCHPEVASVGLTEQQCKEKKLDYKVGKFPFSANGRARTSGETEGFVKIIRDAKYGEILGAHIIGSHATEMIHELVVARDERVHGGGGRPRDPRAPDAVRGGRRGGAGFARADDSRLSAAVLDEAP